MSGYDLEIDVDPSFHEDARNFVAFIQTVIRRLGVKLSYRTRKRGHLYITIDGPAGAIDAVFQDLILNKGLYYYACSIRGSRKKAILNKAVIPIYQHLLESRFVNPYSRIVRRHVEGRVQHGEYIPTDFFDPFAREYEILFRKWDTKLLDAWNFIKDVDSFLTRFMLSQLSHTPGRPSPRFGRLVGQVRAVGVGMAMETADLFNKAHRARTQGLHRLSNSLTKQELSELAVGLYLYFEYFDEFVDAQTAKTELLHGHRYRRIKYGDELWRDENGKAYMDDEGRPYDWKAAASKRPCHDCEAVAGQHHAFGCDAEQCARCGGQRLGCPCKLAEDY